MFPDENVYHKAHGVNQFLACGKAARCNHQFHNRSHFDQML